MTKCLGKLDINCQFCNFTSMKIAIHLRRCSYYGIRDSSKQINTLGLRVEQIYYPTGNQCITYGFESFYVLDPSYFALALSLLIKLRIPSVEGLYSNQFDALKNDLLVGKCDFSEAINLDDTSKFIAAEKSHFSCLVSFEKHAIQYYIFLYCSIEV